MRIPDNGFREEADQQHLLFRKIVQVVNVQIGDPKRHASGGSLGLHEPVRIGVGACAVDADVDRRNRLSAGLAWRGVV